MQILLLYAAVVLIWGTTWAAIPYQLNEVSVPASIGYRFVFAALILYAFALLRRLRLAVPMHALPTVLCQGLLLFCINYIFIYYGTAHITSGLVAVLFSLIVLFNALFGRLFFGTPIDSRLLLAGVLGTLGIGLLFLPELTRSTLGSDVYVGILLVIAGTVSASLGNMAAVVNVKHDLPLVAVNAHGMLLGGVLSLIAAAWMSAPLGFSLDRAYLLSLLYLSVVGSAVAFGCYIALLRRIGAARAAYSSVLFPVVALMTSTLLEGYRWSFAAGVGILCTLVGNWLALSQGKKNSANGEKSNG